MCEGVCACMHACVRACVRACVFVCACRNVHSCTCIETSDFKIPVLMKIHKLLKKLMFLLLGISHPSCYLGFHILRVTDVPVPWDFTSFLLMMFLFLGISYPSCYRCSCYSRFHILPVTDVPLTQDFTSFLLLRDGLEHVWDFLSA